MTVFTKSLKNAHVLAKNNYKMKFRKQNHLNSCSKQEILRDMFNKFCVRPVCGNYKTLLRETKEYENNGRDTMLMDWKTQYC